MSVRLVRKHEVIVEHTATIYLDDKDVEEFILDNPDPDGVNYDEMFDYFSDRGYEIEFDEEAVHYEGLGTEYERI